MQFSLKQFMLATTAIGTFVGVLTAEPIALAYICYGLLIVMLLMLLVEAWLPLLERRHAWLALGHVEQLLCSVMVCYAARRSAGPRAICYNAPKRLVSKCKSAKA